jgi:hypothetical protein
VTRRELEIAQFLLGTYTRAQQLADKVDPRRAFRNEHARELDGIAARAGDAFSALVGRAARHVEITELNTLTPAEWTKLSWRERHDSCPR